MSKIMECISCHEEYERFHEDNAVVVCEKCFNANPGYLYHLRKKDGSFYRLTSGMEMKTISQKLSHKFIYINKYQFATDEISEVEQVKKYKKTYLKAHKDEKVK